MCIMCNKYSKNPYKTYVYYVQQVQQEPLQNICVLCTTSAARTPTRCSVICCKKTTQKTVARTKKSCIMRSMLTNYSSSKNKMQNTNTKQNTTRKQLTKAQIMRDQIALVKQANCASVAQQQAYVIDWMCTTLAFKKQLAKVYVKENWHKVVV